MADNIAVTPGTGKTVATDEVTDATLGTVQVQIVKVMDGTLDSTNKMSISAAGAVKVDGSAVTQPVSGPLTDAQLRAVPVPVSGTVTATGPLTDTQLRAVAVPVSGPLTDTQLRAVAVPVSGTVAVSSVSGSVAVTGPLTDVQLRATSVPMTVSTTTAVFSNGTETAVSSTAVQLIAASASRKSLILQNTGNANIRVGIASVAATTGFRLTPGGIITISAPDNPGQAWFAIRETSVDSIGFAMGAV